MPHLDNASQMYSGSDKPAAIFLLVMFLKYLLIDILFAVFAVLAATNFYADINAQQKLIRDVCNGKSNCVTKAVTEKNSVYSLDYDKLDDEYKHYFNESGIESHENEKADSAQQYVLTVITDKDSYSVMKTKTLAYGLVCIITVAGLLIRAVRSTIHSVM